MLGIAFLSLSIQFVARFNVHYAVIILFLYLLGVLGSHLTNIPQAVFRSKRGLTSFLMREQDARSHTHNRGGNEKYAANGNTAISTITPRPKQ